MTIPRATAAPARADVGPFGRTVRVPLDTDRRVFTPISRSTPRWRKTYARRSAIERVNSRLDNVLGFERHTIRGMKKMEARVSLALLVMLAMALGRIRANQPARIRSLLAPVARATGGSGSGGLPSESPPLGAGAFARPDEASQETERPQRA